MTREELIEQLYQYTKHEEIYRAYFMLDSDKKRADYLDNLKNSIYVNEILWLPGFFDKNEILLSDNLFSSYDSHPNRSIVMQKHNRYTPSKFHQHEFFEMIYVYSGSAIHEIQGMKQTINKGDVLIISPKVRHALSVFDDSIILDSLIRKGTFLNHFFEFLKKDNILSSFFQKDLYLNQHQPIITFHTDKDLELENILLDMFLEHYNEDNLSDNILNNLCMIYFAKLVRKHQATVEVFSSISKENTRLLSIISYIQSNYTTVTLVSVANYFHYAPAYLSNYIKEHTGENFIDLIKNIKLNRAVYLLRSSNLSINDICNEIGYESPPHFFRLFKEKYGLTPAKYRKLTSSYWF